MLRTHNCGELRKSDINKEVTLSGWVQNIRDKGKIIWIDLRDRYGITQLVLENAKSNKELELKIKEIGREFVIKASGTVLERSSPNSNISTGEIEIILNDIEILNKSKVPPFLIEEVTDGGEELRMKFRYLDIRRGPISNNLELRHLVLTTIREYLNKENFIEIETPTLIKSTPEGARDFVVPSRLNPGNFYALPQSPQTFKQLLMIGGMDKYYQIVKCFRDEDLRADRQPEFTQLDCELSFINQEYILNTFESLIRHVFQVINGILLPPFPRITFDDAIATYGTDKPDTRLGMPFIDITEKAQEGEFKLFNDAEIILGICAKGCAKYTRKQIDILTDFVKSPQVGAPGLIYIKYNEDGTVKSSIDKFFYEEQVRVLSKEFEAEKGDIIFILCGKTDKTRTALSELRLKVAENEKLKHKDEFSPLWVLNFPLLEWNKEENRFHARHHPFTTPVEEDIDLLKTHPEKVKANAYDMVINGWEIGGGSIRIHNKELQEQVLKAVGFSIEEANNQFGFLLKALEYGAPPHGGIAFGIARLCSILGGSDQIRDFIAFPKNNSGKDIMIETPSTIAENQLRELKL